MPSEGAQKIIKLFADGLKDYETDISSLLEEYLTEVGLQQLNEDETATQFPNFPEAAIILQHSAAIYCKKVDCLWLMVQNAVQLKEVNENPAPSDSVNKSSEKTTKKSRKRIGLSDFNFIDLEEAANITMKENCNNRPVSILPKAFSQFEPRVVTENDVQLKDYNNESIGLISDFRINWNTDENFMLCDDLDFCTTNKLLENSTVNPSMVSPADSGNLSDCFIDFNANRDILSTNCSTDDAISIEKTVVENNELITKTPMEIKSLLKPRLSKFDMSSPLSGTVKTSDIKVSSCDFDLPSYIMKKVIQREKTERKCFKRFIDDVYSGDDMDAEFSMNKLFPAFKKSRRITWSRLEVLKKLKLAEYKARDTPTKGFSITELPENDIIEALQKKCSHISISSLEDDPDIFATSEIEEDDVPDNCYIGNQNNIFEPNIARRLAEADSLSGPCSTEQNSISKSVEAWHILIQEKLKDVGKRNDFNMRDYSNDILEEFSKSEDKSDKTELKFSKIVKDKCKEDIARYFFTTLSLANKLKISIQQPEPLHCGDFSIKKITKINSNNKNLT